MDDNNTGQITVESIWAKLSAEEKVIFKKAQKDALDKAKAQAKKQNTKRLLDDEDRERVRSCLEQAGCDVKLALNDLRTLALRWVLDNQSDEFGEYIKSLRERKRNS